MIRFAASAASRKWLALLLLPAAAAACWPRLQAVAIAWIRSRHDTRHAVSVAPAAATLAPPLPTLGSHALLGQEDGHGRNPALTSPIDTQARGSSFVVFKGGAVVDARAPSDNHGNAWAPLGPPAVFHGYHGAYDVKAWTAVGGRGGPGHVVSLTKDGAPAGELTLLFVELRHAGRLQDVAQTYAPSGPQVTSGTVTTTGPAVLLAVWWGDAYVLRQSAIPGDGFRLIENFVDLPPDSAVQCAAAYREVDRPGTWRVTWQQAPAQGAILWLLAFEDQDRILGNGFE